ncbi:MAG TPA: type II secretion system protein GspM [Burkholderiales bacterium]|nr:type II secretion system protein GspM [Burkholderiales bacterium]
MRHYYERLQHFWAGRQPREKVFLIALGAFVAVALFAQLLWSSHQARQRLTKQIPQLQQDVETLQRKAATLQELKAKPPSAAPAEGNALLAMAASAAEAAGIREVGPQLKLEGARRLRLRATVPFDRWIEWAAALQRDGQVRLVSCRVQATATQGSAEIDALFALPDPL